jgi:hypothetical protein
LVSGLSHFWVFLGVHVYVLQQITTLASQVKIVETQLKEQEVNMDILGWVGGVSLCTKVAFQKPRVNK